MKVQKALSADAAVTNPESTMNDKPNILFIQVDQMMAASLRCYGNEFCHAPALDALADSGVVFESAYCNFPLCAPSRFSMASGQLCSSIGAYDNAAEFFAEIPTYAHHLRGYGYQTSLSGKMHFIGPDQYHGFEKRLTPDLYPADFSWVPNWGNEGKRDTNDPRSVLISGICERSVQIDFDNKVTTEAIQHLYDIARSSDDRPFFMQVSYTHPHEPYLCQRKYWDLYADKVIPHPTVPALSREEHDAHSIRLLEDFGMMDVEFKDEDIQRSRRAYYGSISYLDDMIGQIINTLQQTGVSDNTAIVFTSDHGEMLGERGMWFKKHFYEPSLRVPLIINAPWIQAGREPTPASLVDLLPTFNGFATGQTWTPKVEELAGIDLTQYLPGNDRAAITPPQPDRPVYAEYLAEATNAPIFMIKRGQYKFIYSRNDPALLFDLHADPLERHNLASHQEQATRVKAFADEVNRKWDSDKIGDAIQLSQQRRQLIRAAVKQGSEVRWNHDEAPEQDVRWYRGKGSYNDWAFDYLPENTSRRT